MRHSVQAVIDAALIRVRSARRVLSLDARANREQLYVERPVRFAIQAITIANSGTKTLVRAAAANNNQAELTANFLVVTPGTSATLAFPAEADIAGIPITVINAHASNSLTVDLPGDNSNVTVAAGRGITFLTAGSGGIVSLPYVAPA